jgi:hypothetical protein
MKKETIIPIMEDEGAAERRDYLQWDTVYPMSLLGIYVIIATIRGGTNSRYLQQK